MALDKVPRITRAQSMDVLSSMANLASYRAVVETARGLGAEVRAFDTRPATREQVESLGGKFLELDFEEGG